MVIIKLLIAIHQFEIAKTLNNERSPVSLPSLYVSFVNAVTLQQTPIERKLQKKQQQEQQPNGVDIEAPGPVEQETISSTQRPIQQAPQAAVVVVAQQVATTNEKE